MNMLRLVVGAVAFFGATAQASAHYLWVTVEARTDGQDVANIIFEESPAAGDGRYLDHFEGSRKTWIRSVEQIEPARIDAVDVREGKKRWLQATLPVSSPRSVDCYARFGVYRYGETNVLLHYYARHLDVSAHEDLHELSRAPHLALEIVPHNEGSEMELTVLWQGQPVANRMVFIRGPKQFRQNTKTDDEGRVRMNVADAGRYTIRTSVEEEVAGRDGDEEYSRIRHHGTLIMTLPLRD
ncbi:Nickel uptake substrate-specific transmembrane region [Maioricimonas rarisocia]|uniref:Nickel uptake substrate-specific transmembrane region n=1 Tax=Maioricimonas rarisocia TaxID=2528026 RepID=A0A517Z931_9PLAN|nr:DUF4198 domain-containing protein [Maioricimonas rarisocia]QDU38988.1 Nickel uptake substrate-specific transmembrane region [Maioricimonas rarisocia]